MTFQQRKICKWALISIFIFSFDNAFADKAVINENACRRQEIGSASFRAQFPNAGIMENQECCQLFLGGRKKRKRRMQMRRWHDGWKKFNPLRTGPYAACDVCLKREGDGQCCWECHRAVGNPETHLSVHPPSRESAALTGVFDCCTAVCPWVNRVSRVKWGKICLCFSLQKCRIGGFAGFQLTLETVILYLCSALWDTVCAAHFLCIQNHYIQVEG